MVPGGPSPYKIQMSVALYVVRRSRTDNGTYYSPIKSMELMVPYQRIARLQPYSISVTSKFRCHAALSPYEMRYTAWPQGSSALKNSSRIDSSMSKSSAMAASGVPASASATVEMGRLPLSGGVTNIVRGGSRHWVNVSLVLPPRAMVTAGQDDDAAAHLAAWETDNYSVHFDYSIYTKGFTKTKNMRIFEI